MALLGWVKRERLSSNRGRFQECVCLFLGVVEPVTEQCEVVPNREGADAHSSSVSAFLAQQFGEPGLFPSPKLTNFIVTGSEIIFVK